MTSAERGAERRRAGQSLPPLFPAETVIPIRAIVADNLALDRVELYLDGRLVATLNTSRTSTTHPITAVGDVEFGTSC